MPTRRTRPSPALGTERSPGEHGSARRAHHRPEEGRVGSRIASNFAILGCAEVVCRALSVFVTLSLAQRLGAAGYGRIEFAFNIVYWMVLVVRDCFEMIVTREIARHPRLRKAIVNRVLAVKLLIAATLYGTLVVVSWAAFRERQDVALLSSYGLLLLSTALGLDFVFRATERVGLVALSLFVRTTVYSAGVLWTVKSVDQLLYIPLWLIGGETVGIGLIWLTYARRYERVRPRFAPRFFKVFLERGRSVVLIHLAQAVLLSADLLLVGLFFSWVDVGRYGAPHRMVSAVLAFGVIFQQVIFPTLARSWRRGRDAGKKLTETASRTLLTCTLPIAVGGTILAESLIRLLLPSDYDEAAQLLRLGVWRIPLFSLALFYQSTLIAMGRESVGLRLLLTGSLAAVPLILGFLWLLGPIGACLAVIVTGLLLVNSGYRTLRSEGRAPVWHHHVSKPLLSCLGMMPVCLFLDRIHTALAVLGGGVAYLGVLAAMGGLDHLGLSEIWNRVVARPGVRGGIGPGVVGPASRPNARWWARPRSRVVRLAMNHEKPAVGSVESNDDQRIQDPRRSDSVSGQGQGGPH